MISTSRPIALLDVRVTSRNAAVDLGVKLEFPSIAQLGHRVASIDCSTKGGRVNNGFDSPMTLCSSQPVWPKRDTAICVRGMRKTDGPRGLVIGSWRVAPSGHVSGEVKERKCF